MLKQISAMLFGVAVAALSTSAHAADKVKIGIVNASSDVVYYIALKKGYFPLKI